MPTSLTHLILEVSVHSWLLWPTVHRQAAAPHPRGTARILSDDEQLMMQSLRRTGRQLLLMLQRRGLGAAPSDRAGGARGPMASMDAK